MMTKKETRPAASSGHVDAKQVELLIGLACNAQTRTRNPELVERRQTKATPEPKFSPARRDSLAAAMIDLIFAPGAF
jgi:hypothetical protein